MSLAALERQATLLQPKGERRRGRDYTPITDLSIWDDVGVLAGEQQRDWRRVTAELSGVPTALLGGIAGLEANPPPDPLAAVTLAATEAALWPTATWTPIQANARTPTQYELFVSGSTTTTATASPTVTFAPRFGLLNTSPALGATPSIALTISITTFWQIRGDFTVRGGGLTSTARVYGAFHLVAKFATTGTGAVDTHQIFGQTAGVTGDSVAATGLWMGVSSAVTTTTMTVQQIRWGSWN